MTSQQIKDVADKYIVELDKEGFKAVHNLAGNISELGHAAWMCSQIKIFVDEGDLDKANRWLGFVQGVLWTQGFYSIFEMRDHNRSDV